MVDFEKEEKRYSFNELETQRKLGYERGYTDGRESVFKELAERKDSFGVLVDEREFGKPIQ